MESWWSTVYSSLWTGEKNFSNESYFLHLFFLFQVGHHVQWTPLSIVTLPPPLYYKPPYLLSSSLSCTHTWGVVDQETRPSWYAYTDGLLASIQQTGKTWRFCLYLIEVFVNILMHWCYILYFIGYDYTHSTVSHSEHFKDPLTGTHTNTIEGRYWYLCVGIEFDTICYFCQVVLR